MHSDKNERVSGATSWHSQLEWATFRYSAISVVERSAKWWYLRSERTYADAANDTYVERDQLWRMAMANFTRRQFNNTLMAAVGAGWAHDVIVARSSVETHQSVTAGSITDVPGIKTGHYTDSRRPTGCTALVFEGKATAGVDYDGSAPGSHLGVLLQPVSPIDTIHGILLTGGGPMGLAAVAGAVRYLEEHKTGFDWGIPNVRVPIVVGTVIDDLALGDARIRPDADAAYKACQAASAAQLEEGNVGVGAGATIGKMLRSKGYSGMKAGVATASVRLGEVIIGALVVANSVGDILDRHTGEIVAGALRPDGKGFANISETLRNLAAGAGSSLNISDVPLRSTTLVVVATNVSFTKTELTKIAMMASTGAARAINPYHTNGDGDSTFAISTNKISSDLGISIIGALAADLVSETVVRAVTHSKSVEGWVAVRDLQF
jgi:L-aminopeptidase/D-esterase-like protein